MMNEKRAVFYSSLIIPHSSFAPILSTPVLIFLTERGRRKEKARAKVLTAVGDCGYIFARLYLRRGLRGRTFTRCRAHDFTASPLRSASPSGRGGSGEACARRTVKT